MDIRSVNRFNGTIITPQDILDVISRSVAAQREMQD